ncbi:MAG: DUF6152 family protein [Vicinamibacterales bacterium]
MLGVASAASAHHSAAAKYDADRTLEIRGTIVEFKWRNPHCFAYIDVAEGPFKGQTYSIEFGSPGVLTKGGWTRDLLRPGDHVAMSVHPSRAGAPVGLCRDCPLTINGKLAKTKVMQ